MVLVNGSIYTIAHGISNCMKRVFPMYNLDGYRLERDRGESHLTTTLLYMHFWRSAWWLRSREWSDDHETVHCSLFNIISYRIASNRRILHYNQPLTRSVLFHWEATLIYCFALSVFCFSSAFPLIPFITFSYFNFTFFAGLLCWTGIQKQSGAMRGCVGFVRPRKAWDIWAWCFVTSWRRLQ